LAKLTFEGNSIGKNVSRGERCEENDATCAHRDEEQHV